MIWVPLSLKTGKMRQKNIICYYNIWEQINRFFMTVLISNFNLRSHFWGELIIFFMERKNDSKDFFIIGKISILNK